MLLTSFHMLVVCWLWSIIRDLLFLFMNKNTGCAICFFFTDCKCSDMCDSSNLMTSVLPHLFPEIFFPDW
jgi:hypothetical protein